MKATASGLQAYLINLSIELIYASEMRLYGAYDLTNHSMSSSLPSIQELLCWDAIMDLNI